MKIKTNYSLLAVFTLVFILSFVFVPQSQAVEKFVDIDAHWAEAAIEKMADAGVASGFPDAAFRPDNKISRAEFAVLIVKAFNLKSTSGKVFSDTSWHWAKEQIATANEYGVVNGYNDNQFGPDDPITREQMALMIVKAAKLPITPDTLNCPDSDRVSSWAKDAVAAAYAHKTISGMPDGSFMPQAYATRAQAVMVLSKAMQTGEEAILVVVQKSVVMGYVLEVTFAENFNVETAIIQYTQNANPIKRDFFASTHEGGNVYRYLGEDISEGDTIGFYVNNKLVKTVSIIESDI